MQAKNETCSGSHRFFALDPIGVQESGKVVVVIVCTSCGELKIHEIQVAKPGTPVTE
jgi:hypothetical protein